MKRTSNHSEQRLFREEVLSFIPKKAKAFSYLFVTLQSRVMRIAMIQMANQGSMTDNLRMTFMLQRQKKQNYPQNHMI